MQMLAMPNIQWSLCHHKWTKTTPWRWWKRKTTRKSDFTLQINQLPVWYAVRKGFWPLKQVTSLTCSDFCTFSHKLHSNFTLAQIVFIFSWWDIVYITIIFWHMQLDHITVNKLSHFLWEIPSVFETEIYSPDFYLVFKNHNFTCFQQASDIFHIYYVAFIHPLFSSYWSCRIALLVSPCELGSCMDIAARLIWAE